MTKRRAGIRRRGGLWEAYVRVEGRQLSKRFPLDTPEQTMRAWRESQRVQRFSSGTLAQDVRDYLLTVRHMPTYEERAYHLAWWVAFFGPERSRLSIATTEINQALSALKTSGKSDTTVRHYRTALLHLFTRLDGREAQNPVRASWRPADPPAEARAIDASIVGRILRTIRAPKTKARLWVMASTGIPHKTLMKLTRESVDWANSRVLLPSRRKGHGAAGRWLPLNRVARAAFKRLETVNGWGPFSPQSMRKRWQEALERLNLPKTLRPYDVRHTVGTLLYRATGDLATVARLLGHATTKTAARYSLDAHAEVDREAMAKVRLRVDRKVEES